MPYTVIVWLTNAIDMTREVEDTLRSLDEDNRPAGGNSGVTIPPLLNRFQYGLYDSQDEAENALQEISTQLEENTPLRIAQRSGEVFVVPAASVHYVVCAEVSRPKDEDNPSEGGPINQ